MTIPINIRWLILGGLALLLIGLGLGYLAFYSSKTVEKTVQAQPIQVPSAPLVKEGKPETRADGVIVRVDTVYIEVPCPEQSSPLSRPEPREGSVFTQLPSGFPEFNFTPTLHMPAFTIHKAQPLVQLGAKVGMDPIQGFWAGSALARLSLGDFHVLAEAGLMRDLFFFVIALEVYFYSFL